MAIKKKILKTYKKSLKKFGGHKLTRNGLIKKSFNVVNSFAISQLNESKIIYSRENTLKNYLRKLYIKFKK